MKKRNIFTFLGINFDVDKALNIINKVDHPIENVEIKELIAFLPQKNKMSAFRIEVDTQYAMTDAVDLEKPIILVFYKNSHIVIDGWHRIYKAAQNGVEQLPGIVLDATESLQILI